MNRAKRELTERIPSHLAPYIVEQDPRLYTAIDHACWRFILKISRSFFSEHAHQKYLDGLQKTGVSSEKIPLISEMDSCLRQFGWRAVAVSGFIPPAAFMEFQSLGILPIACDMRRADHMSYTPAPDIVHEAAGHAPILADPEYAEYLRNYGEVSKKAIYSDEDLAVYHAIRKLSEVKEDPQSSGNDIFSAQQSLDLAIAAQREVSEAALLARMNWWTVEYGLVGPLEAPKIYGAGLLSSVGESYECLQSRVKKIPLSVDCVNYPYDITKPQPQLFVTPNFKALSEVLEEFASSMAYRLGGKPALEKALQAKTTTTTELDSGIQIGGKLVEVLWDRKDQPCYLRFEGPCQLAFKDTELENQGPDYHRHGFGTPTGSILWNGLSRHPSFLQDEELEGLEELIFESGVHVKGSIRSILRKNGKLILISWENCTVTQNNRILFQPDWGTFDMACGEAVLSVYGNAPDRGSYISAIGETPKKLGTQKTNWTKQSEHLISLYAQVRGIRESNRAQASAEELSNIYSELEAKYARDWLLRFELIELGQMNSLNTPWMRLAHQDLANLARSNETVGSLIQRGLESLS